MSWVNTAFSSILGFSNQNVSGSNWGSIHPDLMAVFTQVDFNYKPTGLAVQAVIKEGNVEQELGWNSPFENMNAEGRHPTLTAFAQTGSLERIAQTIGFGSGNKEENSLSAGLMKRLSDLSQSAQGRTGITKLNSRQVFTGHAPLKINMTLLFRAWQDPDSEVAIPYQTLLQMAYPNKLADNQLDVPEGEDNGKALHYLFPSAAPNPVILTYKGETFPPLVIENIGKPLDAPYSPMGDIWLEVPIVLQSLESLDFQDIQKMRNSSLGGFIEEKINKKVALFKE